MRAHARMCRTSLLVAALLALPTLASTAHAQQTGAVRGDVRDQSGLGIVSAEVHAAGGDAHTQSNERGAFVLTEVAPGERALVVRRLGFRPETTTVQVTAGDTARVTITLQRSAQQLAAVEVRGGRREALDIGPLAGFYERSERGMGRYILRPEIDRRNAFRTSDLLRTVPGVRVGPAGGATGAVRVRSARCYPVVWMDGVRLGGTTSIPFDFDNIPPSDLEGIEIYGSATVPAEMMSPDASTCGTVGVWTRRGPDARESDRSTEEVAAELAAAVAALKVYTAEQVDVPARPDDETPIQPAYPDSLARQGVGGRVLVEFVVSEKGRPEMATFGVVTANDMRLVPLVRDAVARARFVAARQDDKPVRQVMLLPFSFVLTGAPPAPPAQAAPTPAPPPR